MTADRVRVWTDPSCPWAWQTSIWLRDLRDRGHIELTYSLFSLEINASEPGTPFRDAAPRYGEALTSLVLARREGGDRAFEALSIALGALLHAERRPIDAGTLAEAATEAGMPSLPDRAAADPGLADEVVREYREARARDVFGVPTLQLDGTKTIYGPILAEGPTGDQGLALWRSVKELVRRDAFFELKRWPRDLRPGGTPTGPLP